MLALTRPHKQVLATLGLVLFTVVPSISITYQVWRARRPEHVRDIERDLGRGLGLKVAIERVRHPRPGEDVLSGVVVRLEGQNESAVLARADVVRVRRDGRDLSIETQGLRVCGESPSQILTQATTLLAKTGGSSFATISVAADGCDLFLGDDLRYVIRSLAAQLSPAAGDAEPTLTVSYQMPSDGPPTRCELNVTRERAENGARTMISFKTMEGPPLPARVLDPFFRSAEWLGTAARVEGSLVLRQLGSAGWEAAFEGNLYDVNLASLTEHQFPDHRLRGQARLRVDSARWGELPGGKQGSGWIEAKGSLTAGQGSISPSLLSAMAGELKFRLPKRPDPAGPDVEFHNLGLRFALNRQGEIQFDGDLGPEFAPGAVLARGDRTTPLAIAPDGAANVVGLRKAMVPVASTDQLVPARAESEFLRHLPLPPGAVANSLKAN